MSYRVTSDMRAKTKFNNVKVVVGGIEFDSKKEAKCYQMLKEKEANGEISNLQRQVVFNLLPSQKYIVGVTPKGKAIYRTERAVDYIADFVYTDTATEEVIVADCKSPITRKDKAYVIKRKLLLYFHNKHLIEL